MFLLCYKRHRADQALGISLAELVEQVREVADHPLDRDLAELPRIEFDFQPERFAVVGGEGDGKISFFEYLNVAVFPAGAAWL